MISTCYMCSQRATGKEHAPPRCFFPEQKDLSPGIDYRKNLIKVPSCDAHNTNKSKDDEYLAFVVVTHFANNIVAARQILTKLLRALSRKPSLRAFFATQRPVLLDGVETLAYKLDKERFVRGMTQMARALYFDRFKEKWFAPTVIHSPAVFQFDNPDGVGLHQVKQNIAQFASGLLEKEPCLGANPEVFWHKIYRDLAQDFLMINMLFYGGVQVIALSHPRLIREPNQGVQAT